tara:strand:+ start:1793 stop:3337 length:1545 start_codon:yes stop_codon:yes gene_type:complete
MPYKRLEITRPKGINIDLSPYELPNELWSEGINVDFRNFRTNRSLGYRQVFSNTTVSPLFTVAWTDFNLPYWFYANETAIYRTEGTTNSDVTRTSGAYTGTYASGWTGNVFNGALIMNNATDSPQFFDVSSSLMADLTAWPTSYVCGVVRPYKNYLISMDITKGNGERFPTMVKWSDSADAGDVPQSWDETNPTTQAGENVLPDTEGRCIDGLALNDSFFIYKGDSVWAMQFIGGNFIFSFRKVFNDAGVLGKDCVVEFEGKHFVVGVNDVYVHDGTSKQSVISNQIKKKLYSQIDNNYIDKVKCQINDATKEIWIYFPSLDSTNGLCDRALVWDWEVKVWSQREISNISYIARGNIDPQESDAWDDEVLGWDTDSSVWGEESFNPSQTELVLCDYTNNKFYQGNRSTTLNGVLAPSSVERVGLDFGDDLNYKYVNTITPHFSGEGTVNIYIGTENHQGQGIAWSVPFLFNIGVDYKADFRESGRYIAIKFESPTDNLWTLTGYTIEYEETGIR